MLRNTAFTRSRKKRAVPIYTKSQALLVYALRFLFIGCASIAQGGESLHSWGIDDSIKQKYFSCNQVTPELWLRTYEDRNSGGYISRYSQRYANCVVWAPAKDFLFFVKHWGDISNDKNVYEMSVFSEASIQQSLAAKSSGVTKSIARVQFASKSNTPGISGAVWADEGRAIVFMGMDGSGVVQLFRLRVPSGDLEKLTELSDGITEFSYLDGGAIVTKARPRERSTQRVYPMLAADRGPEGQPLREDAAARLQSLTSTHVLRAGKKPHLVDSPFEGAWIAPGGQRAIGLCCKESRGFVLVDIESGRTIPLVGVRYEAGDSPSVFWLNGSNHVILANVLLAPETSSPSSNGPQGPASRYVVDYDLDTARVRLVRELAGPRSHRYAVTLQRTRAGDEILVDESGDANERRTAYRLEGDEWISRDVGNARSNALLNLAENRGGILVELRESANDPPSVVASNRKREIVLDGVDPSLNSVRRARVDSFSWTDPDGSEITGALLLPPVPVKQGKLPLVIQLEAEVELRQFQPDGQVSAAYAAQALAAQGFAVLRVPGTRSKMKTSVEGSIYSARLDAAVEALEQRVPIDRAHVGLIGHSRLGYRVYYVITHPGRVQFAAAIVDDSFTGSYMSYLTGSATMDVFPLFEPEFLSIMGGENFWRSKERWMEHEVTFNVDKVQTPAMFVTHGAMPRDETISYDVIGAFNANHKPLEYLWLPEAVHVVQRPQERLALMGATIAWMQFWLQDAAPSDAQWASRWKDLRAQQRDVLDRSRH